MINNSSRTLGAPRGGDMGGGNQQEMDRNYRQGTSLNRLVGSIVANSHSNNGGGQRSDGGGFSSYSYNKGAREGIFGDMFGASKEVTDEQYRADVIDQASMKGTELNFALQNRSGIYYQETKNAIEYFKRDRNGTVQSVFEEFTNEIESNLQLYRFCASYASLFYAADLVNSVYAGTVDQFINDGNYQLKVLGGNFVNVLCLQYMSWLEGHPDGANILNMMSPANKKQLEMFEGMIEPLQNKVNTMSIGQTVIPFPWRKGTISRIHDRYKVTSPILDNYDFHQGQEVYAPHQSSWPIGNTGTHENEAAALIYKLADRGHTQWGVQKEQPEEMKMAPNSDYLANTWGVGTRNTNQDREVSPAALAQKVTAANRLSFDPTIWFKRVEGLSEPRYIIAPSAFQSITRFMKLKSDVEGKPPFEWIIQEQLDSIPLVQIDWEEGLYDYELISRGGYDVKTVLTNPQLVLPNIDPTTFKAVEQKAFDEYWEETNKIIDSDGVPTQVEKCVALDKLPTILYGNRPVEVGSAEEIISTINSLSDYHDPKEELSAFVIPFTAKKIYQLESDIDYSVVYKHFPNLVKGKCNAVTMKEFVAELAVGISMVQSNELKSLIMSHVTHAVNRWLVETRFYPEVKEHPQFIALDNLIDDMDVFCNHLAEYDQPSFKAFLNLTKNDFLRENLPLFADETSREDFVKKELDKCSDVLKLAKEKQMGSAVVIERDFIVNKINPMDPIAGWDQKIVTKAAIPAFDNVYTESQEHLNKHFNRPVTVLTLFAKCENARLWITTPSGFDKGVYSLRCASISAPIQLLRIAK